MRGDNLSPAPVKLDWASLFALEINVAEGFLTERDDSPPQSREPLWPSCSTSTLRHITRPRLRPVAEHFGFSLPARTSARRASEEPSTPTTPSR
ncbi:MAG: hypothetical protein E6K23_18510 [Gammaproteobacteria bacterium]|nr:MAG: hypothetical protein E6K23_18510 [Gammaproteobacteria bacterium]